MQTIGDLATSGTGSSNAIVGGHSNLGTLTVNQTGTSVFSGNLGGVEPNQNNLHLVKTGAGDLTLAGSNLTDAKSYSQAFSCVTGSLYPDPVSR